MAFFDFLKEVPIQPDKILNPVKDVKSIPNGRLSEFYSQSPNLLNFVEDMVSEIDMSFIREIIPNLRKLCYINSDVGLALFDIVQLTNTGHRLIFDKGTSQDSVDEMRKHIRNKSMSWGDGSAGISTLVNKMISQVYITGALSNEWIPNKDLTGIDNLVLVNPETIYFKKNTRKKRFEPHQILKDKMKYKSEYKKLNENTYKYFSLNGDTETPYSIPPFLTSLEALATQKDMKINLNYVMKQLGLLGFFEVLLEKPENAGTLSETDFENKLTELLTKTRKNMLKGMNQGVVVGYKDDHEFNFHSTTKNLNGVSDLWSQNQVQLANGLKQNPAFMGVSENSGTETAITVIFTKMLSQLKNVHEIIKTNLEFGYTLELRLAGYKFDSLEVRFNPSTITDELKLQQSQEIKIRNVYNKYNMGIIDQEQAADELGYEKPAEKAPIGPIDESGKDKKEREDDKDKSDRKSRDKGKTQPKRKDQDTKER